VGDSNLGFHLLRAPSDDSPRSETNTAAWNGARGAVGWFGNSVIRKSLRRTQQAGALTGPAGIAAPERSRSARKTQAIRSPSPVARALAVGRRLLPSQFLANRLFDDGALEEIRVHAGMQGHCVLECELSKSLLIDQTVLYQFPALFQN
jgi:hypothetical protein